MYHSFFAEKIGKEHPGMQSFHNELKEQFLAFFLFDPSLGATEEKDKSVPALHKSSLVNFEVFQKTSGRMLGIRERSKKKCSGG